ncbi:MAG: GIY-YIG nuclease family protein [Candidatus Methanomethylophilaceae archaeon]|jgi:putative endonuclease
MTDEKEWHVYILRCSDGTLYTGISNDLDRRIGEHNKGTGAKYTKGRGPVRLVYQESADNRSEASKRELEIKSLTRSEKLMLIEK